MPQDMADVILSSPATGRPMSTATKIMVDGGYANMLMNLVRAGL